MANGVMYEISSILNEKIKNVNYRC